MVKLNNNELDKELSTVEPAELNVAESLDPLFDEDSLEMTSEMLS